MRIKTLRMITNYNYVELLKRSKYTIAAIIFLIIITTLSRLSSLSLPLDRDEGAYGYIGWMWLTGKGVPYLSAFDHKPPLPYLLYGIVSIIGGNSFQTIRIFSLFYSICIVIIFYLFCLHLTRRSIAFLTSLIFIFYTTSIRLEGTNFNTEVQMMLPFLLFILYLWRLHIVKNNNTYLAFITGVLGGMAILFRVHAAFSIFLLIMWFTVFSKTEIFRKRKKQLLQLFVGLVIPILFLCIYFAFHLALGELIADIFFYNVSYIEKGFNYSIASVVRISAVILPFFIFTLITFLLTIKQKTELWWFVGILFVSSLLTVKFGGVREYVHYYLPVLISLCLSFILFSKYVKSTAIVWGAGVVLIAFVLVPEIHYHWKSTSWTIQIEQFKNNAVWFHDAIPVSAWIEKNIPSYESVYVWANEAEIYYYAKRKAENKYIYLYPLGYTPKAVKEFGIYLKQSPPDWIITYNNDPVSAEILLPFLQAHREYKLVKTIGSYFVIKSIR